MDNKIAPKNEVSVKEWTSEKEGDTVKDAIERLNALYASACENADAVRKMFTDRGVKSKFGFYNNHAIAVDDGYIYELYPIPIVTLELDGVSADIGFDIVSRNGNIGFLELTVDKAVLVEFDFTKLTEYEFAIYGVEHYLDDYWFGDIEATKEMIEKSDEKQFHIGFEFPDMAVLKKLLDAFCVVTNGASSEITDVADHKMLGKK